MITLHQKSKYTSPWTRRLRFKKYLWDVVWTLFCRTTPKPFNIWRIFIFKIFGGNADGVVFIHQSARIHFPWNVTLHNRSSLGERSWIYSLGKVRIGQGATIAQEVFLCTGSHNFTSLKRELTIGEINIGSGVFIAAKVTVLPNITIGDNAIVGIGSVVTKNVCSNQIVAGNPAKKIKSKFVCI